MKVRQVTLFIAAILLSTPTLATEKMDTIYARGALLMEKDSKRVLFERHGKNKMPMASTTKIMTCIVALENGKLDDIVTASSRASKAPKVKLGLKVDEKQRLGDLLYSLMLESHNDSAVAIAEHVGGSVESFCQMMTEKAHELGAIDTSFETPSGLDGDSHYSTPYDMALITGYAIENDKFIEITNTLEKQIPSEPLEGSKSHHLVNKNRFIREYQGAIGVKTGYTSKAGHCFIGAVNKNDMQLISVALGTGCDKAAKTRKYTDVKKMMNYGYSNYKKYKLVDEDTDAGTVGIENGKEQQLEVAYSETVVVPLNKDEKETVQIKMNLPETVLAPIEEGEVLGEAEIVCNNEIIGKTEVVAKHSVSKASFMDKLKKAVEDFKNKYQVN